MPRKEKQINCCRHSLGCGISLTFSPLKENWSFIFKDFSSYFVFIWFSCHICLSRIACRLALIPIDSSSLERRKKKGNAGHLAVLRDDPGPFFFLLRKFNVVVVGIGWLGSHTSWSRGGARTSSLSPTATKTRKLFIAKQKKDNKLKSRREFVFPVKTNKTKEKKVWIRLGLEFPFKVPAVVKKKEEKSRENFAPSPIRMDSHVSGSKKN